MEKAKDNKWQFDTIKEIRENEDEVAEICMQGKMKKKEKKKKGKRRENIHSFTHSLMIHLEKRKARDKALRHKEKGRGARGSLDIGKGIQ